jgi:hypothetical protein
LLITLKGAKSSSCTRNIKFVNYIQGKASYLKQTPFRGNPDKNWRKFILSPQKPLYPGTKKTGFSPQVPTALNFFP